MQDIDLVISPRWIIPVVPRNQVLEHCSVAVHGGRILALLPTREIAARFRPLAHLERPDHALIPGLINAHTHAAMTLLRGYADDLPLEAWLKRHILPAENRWVSEAFVRDGTELAVAEMLKGGITCFNDMYYFPDVVARVAAAVGMRVSAGLIVQDTPSPWAETAADYLRKGLRVRDEYKGHPLVSFSLAPHSPFALSDDTLARVQALSDQLDLPVQMHVHETQADVDACQEATGERPLARLDRHGLLTPALQAVHMTQLLPDEIHLLAQKGVQVVHCPESNLKLASGLCPVSRLASAGVGICLGTDGAASNNNLDMLGEMRTAALLAKGISGDAAALPAHRVLEMATIEGARCLGLAGATGSLEAGKWADMATVNLKAAGSQPVYDPVSQLVYCADRNQVNDVWVAGRAQVADAKLTRLNEKDVIARADLWRERISAAPAQTGAARPAT